MDQFENSYQFPFHIPLHAPMKAESITHISWFLKQTKHQQGKPDASSALNSRSKSTHRHDAHDINFKSCTIRTPEQFQYSWCCQTPPTNQRQDIWSRGLGNQNAGRSEQLIPGWNQLCCKCKWTEPSNSIVRQHSGFRFPLVLSHWHKNNNSH